MYHALTARMITLWGVSGVDGRGGGKHVHHVHTSGVYNFLRQGDNLYYTVSRLLLAHYECTPCTYCRCRQSTH